MFLCIFNHVLILILLTFALLHNYFYLVIRDIYTIEFVTHYCDYETQYGKNIQP